VTSWLHKSLARLLLIAAAVLATAASAQDLKRETRGRIDFASFTPKTLFDLARERRSL
jgi:hypothetical protein